ncbi:hypothetical protein HYQ46_005494 [Verticillium longisporum]|nr:hypothetical protein HYQ44_005483 [Verticillium longisporum]KAG7152787.1 hypothetical protein HYQ46_005494 [Verticillium longisporum]
MFWLTPQPVRAAKGGQIPSTYLADHDLNPTISLSGQRAFDIDGNRAFDINQSTRDLQKRLSEAIAEHGKKREELNEILDFL